MYIFLNVIKTAILFMILVNLNLLALAKHSRNQATHNVSLTAQTRHKSTSSHHKSTVIKHRTASSLTNHNHKLAIRKSINNLATTARNHKSASPKSANNEAITAHNHKSAKHYFVTQYIGSKHHIISLHNNSNSAQNYTSRHSKYSRHHHVIARAKTKYAYPINFFMTYAPYFDSSPLPKELKQQVTDGFANGQAGSYPASYLVKAGIVKYHPLRGGIFWRREKVKYIVMHSTETGIPQSAPRVIDSWSSLGIRHAGAQYVVDRDGTIYQACDPDLGTVHLNIFKTLPHINNDNCVGIEMNHAGSQTYTKPQLDSVSRLVSYLKSRYHVSQDNIITHRYAQQGDHTDPVNFDWNNFIVCVNEVDMKRDIAMATKVNNLNNVNDSNLGDKVILDPPTAYLQLHKQIKDNANTGQTNTQVKIQNSDPAYSATANNSTDNLANSPKANSSPTKFVSNESAPNLRGPIDLDPNSIKLETPTNNLPNNDLNTMFTNNCDQGI